MHRLHAKKKNSDYSLAIYDCLVVYGSLDNTKAVRVVVCSIIFIRKILRGLQEVYSPDN